MDSEQWNGPQILWPMVNTCTGDLIWQPFTELQAIIAKSMSIARQPHPPSNHEIASLLSQPGVGWDEGHVDGWLCMVQVGALFFNVVNQLHCLLGLLGQLWVNPGTQHATWSFLKHNMQHSSSLNHNMQHYLFWTTVHSSILILKHSA